MRSWPFLRASSFSAAAALVLTLTGCGFFDPAPGSPDDPEPSSPPVTSPPATAAPTSDPTPVEGPSSTPAASSAGPEAGSWTETYDNVKTGVALITSSRCEGAAYGTGFFIADDLIMTAAHVVSGATALTVDVGGELTTASIIGSNEAQDLALLRTDSRLDGHLFEFSPQPPLVAEEVAALGYPLSGPLTFTSGRVSIVDRTVEVGDYSIANITQTDTAINPGNSGGPLILLDGTVAGVVVSKRTWVGNTIDYSAEGTSWAVSGERAAAAAAGWQANPDPVGWAACVGDDSHNDDSWSDVEVYIESGHASASDVGRVLSEHGKGINTANYLAAYALFTPEMQARLGPVETWSSGLKTTLWQQVAISDVTGDETGLVAEVALRTTQNAEDGPEGGQTCSVWWLNYTLKAQAGDWLISSSQPVGRPRPCSS